MPIVARSASGFRCCTGRRGHWHLSYPWTLDVRNPSPEAEPMLTLLLALSSAGTYHDVTEKPGSELKIGVTFTLWIPDGVKTLRGVIVHQHGCGSGACKGGATAAYDLHWQALSKKHACA